MPILKIRKWRQRSRNLPKTAQLINGGIRFQTLLLLTSVEDQWQLAEALKFQLRVLTEGVTKEVAFVLALKDVASHNFCTL